MSSRRERSQSPEPSAQPETVQPSARSSRTFGLLVCAGVYAAALAGAALVAWALRGQPALAAAAAADAAATALVFAASVKFDNSSLYDPYWSVAPVPLALFWAIPAAGRVDATRRLALLALVGVWAARLTWNWARGWRGLGHEDWRYRDLRRTTGRAYWLVSLLGLHFMPTTMVFLGCLPLHAALTTAGRPFGVLDLAALAVTAAAIVIETVADAQLARFRRARRRGDEVLATGLWAWSRHPNYFGEVLFWWGIGLAGLAAAPHRPWLLLGPAAITALFVFVSIPLMERHMLARHPDWGERRRRVSALVPWLSE